MKKENLHQPFEISVKELEESPLKEHEHTFFELVYILSGTGLQCINNNKFDYHEGHMFLITPQDCHSFDIHTTTKFFFIRFNDIYIHSGFFGTKNIKNLEFILQHANHQPGCILKNITDKPLIKSIIEALIREYVNQDLYNKEDFAKNGIELNFIKMNDIKYKQFNNEFVPNLSIIDVMMFNSPETIIELLNKYTLI